MSQATLSMLLRRLFRIPPSRSPLLLTAAYTRLLWVLIVLWCELGVFYYALSDCKWPMTEPSPNDAHILIVADPQVLDRTSYPGRATWLMTVTQHVVDYNLRKSWKAVRSKMKPDAIVFLGDMMDNGRRVRTEEEYEEYYSKFRSIFRHDNRTMPAYFLPGNHDVDLGLYSPPDLKFLARIRYGTYFGATNRRVIMHNATFVFLDAPGIVDEYLAIDNHLGKDWKKHARKGGALSFLLRVAYEKPKGPLILLTHIPLFRPAFTGPSILNPCGPLREHDNTIYHGYGNGYQNLLPKAVSSFILETVSPDVIFSGDDHDHCAYTHTWHLEPNSASKSVASPVRSSSPSSYISPIPETTISSFSMAMGIQMPGFQLLTIPHPNQNQNQTYITTPCFLPSQVRIYTQTYVPFALLSLVCLIGAALYENKLREDGVLPMYSHLEDEPKGDAGIAPVNTSYANGGPKADWHGSLRKRGRWCVFALWEVGKTVGLVVVWYAVVWCWITGLG